MDDKLEAFSAWLRHLTVETERLHSLLEQERAALEGRQVEALISLSEEKNKTVTQINELMVQLSGAPKAGEDFIESLFNALDVGEGSEIVRQWRRIQELTRRCREMNETNGALIALMQETNRQAMTLFFGQRREQVDYGADGQTRANSDARLLGAG